MVIGVYNMAIKTLRRWHMRLTNEGVCIIKGYDDRGLQMTLTSNEYDVTAFETDYFKVSNADNSKEYILNFSDKDWKYLMAPTYIKKIPYKNCKLYAINDLLALSAMYASELIDVLNLLELQDKYPTMYDNVNIDKIAGSVITAIRRLSNKPF
jgi:hypothetical protein